MTIRALIAFAVYSFGSLTSVADDDSKPKLPEKENFHLFVLAGQSNMAGRGKVTEEDRKPDTNVLMFTKEEVWVSAIDPVHFDKPIAGVGIARSFARAYLESHPDVTVGLIPCAVGGSPIAVWKPGGFHKSTNTHPFDDAVKRIKSAKLSGEIKGILWHQGEGDSKDGLADKYELSLRKTLFHLRNVAQNNPPIVIGQMGKFPSRPWDEARKKVDQAHQRLASQIPMAALVSSEGLSAKSDGVHFDRTSLLEFGVRYAKALETTRAPSEEDLLRKRQPPLSTPKE